LEAGPNGLVIQAKNSQTAIVRHVPGDFPSEKLSVPFQFLADCEGRGKEPVALECQKGGKVMAQWTDGSVPQLLEYESVDGKKHRFPPMPKEPSTNDSRLLDALRDAMGTTDPASARYSLGCVQLRGSNGDVIATDGQQLLLQNGFEFPWDDDLLVLGNAVFGSKELRGDGSVTIGKTDKWITLQSGSWTIHLAIEKERRFPEVADHIQSIEVVTTRLSLSKADADFLKKAIKRLPDADEYNKPITVDLNGSVAIRAQAGDQAAPTEVALTSSTGSGETLRFNTNRDYLARAINLGFRDFCLYGPEAPAQTRDANRIYVWALLHKDGAIKPSKDAIRVEPSNGSQQSPANTNPTTERTRRTMSISKQSNNGDTHKNGDGNGKSDAAGIATLIEHAEAVKASLSTALTETKQLVAALRKHRQQSKALQSTLASLRQLQTLDV